MAERNERKVCAVCREHADSMLLWKRRSWLCPTHASVARWLIPAPETVGELRALFPLRVTSGRRSRAVA